MRLSTLLAISLSATLAAQTTSRVIPAAQATALGNASSMFPFSYTNYVRLQQAIGTQHFGSPVVLHGMALRSRTNVLAVPEVQNQGMEVRLSDCVKPVTALDPTYANNVGANVKVVFNATFNIQRPNAADALEFNTLIPFDQPYIHLNTAPLLIDLIPTSFMGQQCNGGGNGTSFDYMSTDPDMATIFGKGSCGTPPTSGGNPGAGGYVLKFFTSGGLLPFGKTCAGASVPVIGSLGQPNPGNANFAVQLTNTPAGTPPLAALLLGATNTAWGGNNLPWELSGLNMPNCFLTVAIDAAVTAPVGGGMAISPVPIPNNQGLVGRSFYAQWFAVANGANPFGGITSQAGIVTIR